MDQNEQNFRELMQDHLHHTSPKIYLVELIDPEGNFDLFGVYSTFERAQERMKDIARQEGEILYEDEDSIEVKYNWCDSVMVFHIRQEYLDNAC